MPHLQKGFGIKRYTVWPHSQLWSLHHGMKIRISKWNPFCLSQTVTLTLTESLLPAPFLITKLLIVQDIFTKSAYVWIQSPSDSSITKIFPFSPFKIADWIGIMGYMRYSSLHHMSNRFYLSWRMELGQKCAGYYLIYHPDANSCLSSSPQESSDPSLCWLQFDWESGTSRSHDKLKEIDQKNYKWWASVLCLQKNMHKTVLRLIGDSSVYMAREKFKNMKSHVVCLAIKGRK